MSEKFAKHLDHVISENFENEGADAPQDLVNLARELMGNVSRMKTEIESAELQLAHILEELNSSLGREIRKIQPKMAINLRNGNCSCGYHSRDIVCRPDTKKGIWNIAGKLGSGFRRSNPEALHLDHDVTPLARAITDYFKKYYRTL